MGIRPGISLGREDFKAPFFAGAVQVVATIFSTIILTTAALVFAAYVKG